MSSGYLAAFRTTASFWDMPFLPGVGCMRNTTEIARTRVDAIRSPTALRVIALHSPDEVFTSEANGPLGQRICTRTVPEIEPERETTGKSSPVESLLY